MKLKHLTQDDFQNYIMQNKNVVVKFTAPWCGPCVASQPIFERAADQHPDVSFVEVDVDQQPRLAAMFNIRSIPTTMGWKDAKMIWHAVGAPTPQTLDKEIQKMKAA